MIYGKKQIFDVENKTYIEQELTEEEKVQFDANVAQHEKELQEMLKTRYLLNRSNDAHWPTLEEKVEALWSQDQSKIDEINARIKEIENKYPAPRENE